MSADARLQEAARRFVLPRQEGKPGDVEGLRRAALEYAAAVELAAATTSRGGSR